MPFHFCGQEAMLILMAFENVPLVVTQIQQVLSKVLSGLYAI